MAGNRRVTGRGGFERRLWTWRERQPAKGRRAMIQEGGKAYGRAEKAVILIVLLLCPLRDCGEAG